MSEPWTEAAAEERWLDDMELEEAAAELVRKRLAEPEVDGTARELAFRAAAARWLDRGQAQVALSLVDRSTSAGPVQHMPSHDPRAEVPIDALMARIPGVGGLPALTDAEADALRSSETPDEALVILAGAKARLESHGTEARRLLQRWLDRS